MQAAKTAFIVNKILCVSRMKRIDEYTFWMNQVCLKDINLNSQILYLRVVCIKIRSLTLELMLNLAIEKLERIII